MGTVGNVTARTSVLYLGHGLLGEADMIDRDGVAPSEVLARTRQKRLGKEKARYPEDWRRFVPQPPAIIQRIYLRNNATMLDGVRITNKSKKRRVVQKWVTLTLH